MTKSKKAPIDNGGVCEGVPAKTTTPEHEEKKDVNPGIIGIGMPMGDRELQALKEKAKKLDE